MQKIPLFAILLAKNKETIKLFAWHYNLIGQFLLNDTYKERKVRGVAELCSKTLLMAEVRERKETLVWRSYCVLNLIN